MAIRVIVVVSILTVTCGSLMIRFREQGLKKDADKPGPVKPDDSDIPKPATGSAVPKAVVIGERLHDFGAMALGSKGEHTFKIRNEGTAPLELVARKQDHSCQCTLGQVGTNGLPPGEETIVTLSWEIKNPSMHFHHFAKVRTNDPEKEGQELTFRVRGLVARRIAIRPENGINVGIISDDKPVVKKFTVYSELADSFQLQSVVPSIPTLTALARPLSEEEIKELNVPNYEAEIREGRMSPEDLSKSLTPDAPNPLAGPFDEDKDQKEFHGKRTSVKSGYEVTVTLPTALPAGRFRESVTIQTDLEPKPLIVSMEGTRSGPFQIIGTPGSGWNATNSQLNLGRFPASEGKKARLLVFVKKADEDLKVVSNKSVPATVAVQLVKDEKFKGMGREKFDLFIEVPAGAAPVTTDSQHPGSILLETNHPDASQIKLELEFASY